MSCLYHELDLSEMNYFKVVVKGCFVNDIDIDSDQNYALNV